MNNLVSIKNLTINFKENQNVDIIFVSYQASIEHPKKTAKKVNLFLGGKLNETNMSKVIDKKLYRNQNIQS